MPGQTTWFITGTSRGIGEELVRQLSADPTNIVIASCRNPEGATTLKSLAETAKGKVYIIKVDVSDESSIRAAPAEVAKILGDTIGLDYLINNAAVSEGDDRAFGFSVDGLLKTIKANVGGPALLSEVLLPYLERGNRKVIVNLTSGLASFQLDIGPKCASYSISKTALNMLTYKMAREKPEIITFVIDPGWVKTELGGEGAFLEPHVSVEGLLKVFKGAKKADSGGFFDYQGKRTVW